MTHRIWALWVCGCGFEQRVWVAIDERAPAIAHDHLGAAASRWREKEALSTSEP